MKTTSEMKKRLELLVIIFVSALQLYAQGIIINKTDGTQEYIPSDVIKSISTYGYEGNSSLKGMDNGHEYVDLGLPSGTMWATCNVGASKPESYGDYYAWGETATKSKYNSNTYTGPNAENNVHDIAGTNYDVAHVKWGGDWRMPTGVQITELFNNTTWNIITQNGVKGVVFISKNNSMSLFFPYAGYRYQGDLEYVGKSGSYWSSTAKADNSSSAYGFDFPSYGGRSQSSYGCIWGRSVRPVRKNQR